MNRTCQLAVFVLMASTAFACGSERAKVKNLQDETFAAALVSGEPVLYTPGALRSIQRPAKLPRETRLPIEHTYAHVPALMVGYKLEADGDYHIVLQASNNSSQTFIAEIPDPRCGNSMYADEFKAARTAVEAVHKPAAKGKFLKLDTPVSVTVDGMLFFDKDHGNPGQTGHAPNNIEVHPVLAFKVVQ